MLVNLVSLLQYFLFPQINGVDGSNSTEATDKSPLPSEQQPNTSPVCRFVNVKLCGVEPAQGVKGHQATVLLENPQGKHMLNLDHLTREVRMSTLRIRKAQRSSLLTDNLLLSLSFSHVRL